MAETNFKEPTLAASFSEVRDSYTKKEYYTRFAKRLFEALKRAHGVDVAADVFKYINSRKLKIINPETFFMRHQRMTDDIGYQAYKIATDNGRYRFNPLTFQREVIAGIKRELGKGSSKIDLSSVFVYLGQTDKVVKNYFEEGFGELETIVTSIVSATLTYKEPNPFVIKLFHHRAKEGVAENLGIECFNHYFAIMKLIFDTLKPYLGREKHGWSIPDLRLVLPIVKNSKRNQESYLTKLFGEKITVIKELTKGVDLNKRSIELIGVIQQLKNHKKYYTMNTDVVIRELERIGRENTYATYVDKRECTEMFGAWKGLAKSYVGTYNITFDFIEEGCLNRIGLVPFVEVEVSCGGLPFEDCATRIGAAAMICMAKLRFTRSKAPNGNTINSPVLKLTLTGIADITQENMDKIYAKLAELRSEYNQEFVFEIRITEEAARCRFGEKLPTHIRVISDIHTDVNSTHANYMFDFGNDFVVNCGDTSSTREMTADWIRTFIRRGVNVAGNHLGYSDPICRNWETPEIARTKEAQATFLLSRFSEVEHVSFLSNTMSEYEGIIFIGATLFTDFKLFGEENKIPCMMEASRSMNDFRRCTRLVKPKKKGGKITARPFTPEDYTSLFKIGLGYIGNRLKSLRKEGNNKPVVIVTHHAPVPFGIAPKYKDDPLSAAFASDAREFLKEYKDQIRMWCWGHCHNSYDGIYEGIRLVCEPFGYYWENNYTNENIKEYGKRIPLKDIKGKRKWEDILKKEIKKGEVKVES